jgi:hypothetical protein
LVISTPLSQVRGGTFLIQGYFVRVEVDASVDAYVMIWMNRKLEDLPGNVFYATNLAIGIRTVRNLDLVMLRYVEEATEAREEEEETRVPLYL